ncbi:50S ribosomal protein L13 [Candidatus Uhrbacteria bacterium CG10_big_fil_rev_8_21_14_0_10_48_16]|uniref:Large ribosomal subunit protein uL13 n=1 Tax=Candidatus Uhrbacteria bacterium CG10_big_fil_rev_8_21_14_0_10_48_16 TaxID=1975038 RepID=A0A2M8LGC0_9BACT|nr:MAG: 50S ribosomal protein L13 [Candidatus Uhrbacteria bacterium CG10_big_fil_rev_8_21_14_0_10_48_16]
MNVMSREIHTLDAEGKAPGRLATEIARLLIGKHKSTYTPHIDDGDHVQVLNASKMVVTGKKMDQKVYYHHTEYAQGLREKKMSKVWNEDPGEVLRRAVSRMLPKNKHRNERLKRLVVTN